MAAPQLLSQKEVYQAIARKISLITGIELGEKQESLVASRLGKYLRSLGHMSPAEYWLYFQANEEIETKALISLLTTHHTFFFREQEHFDFLVRELPNLIRSVKEQGRREILVWSAACSHGHEGYSLAMFLHYHLKALGSPVGFRILFSDVDSESVSIAQDGIYRSEELERIPSYYRSDLWTKGRGKVQGYLKIKDSIRNLCSFKDINLFNLAEMKRSSSRFDLIFCRNVFIYFKPKDVERISNDLLSLMADHGAFFIGASESLTSLSIPLQHVGMSIYKKTRPEGAAHPMAHALSAPAPVPVVPHATFVPKTKPLASLGAPRIDQDFVIAIGASTGGTDALSRIVSEFPENMPPILIVQHIPGGFSKAFAERMNRSSRLEVKEAEDGEHLRPGVVYVAPGTNQMELSGYVSNLRISIKGQEKVSGHCPSVDVLMLSIARVLRGKMLGVILTGMGSDGAKGLLAMKKAGALTLGQDEASSVVYGMPKVAYENGAVSRVVGLSSMAQTIVLCVTRKHNHS